MGFEPTRPRARDSKSRLSANSSTSPIQEIISQMRLEIYGKSQNTRKHTSEMKGKAGDGEAPLFLAYSWKKPEYPEACCRGERESGVLYGNPLFGLFLGKSQNTRKHAAEMNGERGVVWKPPFWLIPGKSQNTRQHAVEMKGKAGTCIP